VVELSNGNVTSRLAGLPAAEIQNSPFFDCGRISHRSRERYTVDPKHVLNTKRKPWLLYHLVTSDLQRSLADEIAIPPLSTIREGDITIEWCVLHKQCVWNTNRKPWSN
jgi:uncharacterized Fe-S cluster protein YjdI